MKKVNTNFSTSLMCKIHNVIQKSLWKSALCFCVFLSFSAFTSAQNLPGTNQYVPIINGSGPFISSGGGTNITASNSALGFSGTGNIIDGDLNNYASLSAAGSLTGGWIEVDYTQGPFPAGSEIGFIVNKGLLSLGLLNGITVSTYSDANPPDQTFPLPSVNDGTLVESVITSNLVGVGIADDKEKIGFVANRPFRRVRIAFSGLNLGSIVSAIRVYNAQVLIPEAGVAPSCNMPTALSQSEFPAVVNYGTTGLVGSGGLTSAQLSNILNTMTDLENIVSPSTTDYATLSPVNASILGDAYISVKLLEGSIPKNYFAGFELENSSNVLAADLLNGLTIQVLKDGLVVQQEATC